MEKPRKTFELRLRSFYDNDQEIEGTQNKRVHWRKALKKDPKKYKDYLKFDSMRAQLRRDEVNENLRQPGNENLLKDHRAVRARKAREYRAKKKLQKQEDVKKIGKKCKTRAENEKRKVRREKDNARKRKERAKIPKKVMKQINAKRCEARKQEKEDLHLLLLQDQQEVEREKERLQQEVKRLEQEWAKLEAAKSTPERSKVAKRKSLGRARRSISTEAIVYADTVEELVTKASPRKKKLLKDKGLLSTRDVDKIIAEGLTNRFRTLCKSRKKKDLQLKRDLGPALSLAKKYKCQRKVCKALKISPKIMTKPANRPHKRRVSAVTTTLVNSYYTQHSITLPDKKLVSKRTNLPARFLTETISSLYAKFNKSHPTVHLGLSKFAAMRPQGVKLRSSIKYRGCLCEYCANVELKITTINNACHQNRMPSMFRSIYDLSRATLCPRGPDNRYNKLACINRECSHCGITKITEHLEPLLSIQKDNPVGLQWKKWEREEEKDKKGKKMVLKQHNGTLGQLIQDLQDDASTLSIHLFNALWQNDQFNSISGNPPEGWVVMVLDFAENYSCRYQDEIQSVHWGHSSATIHPIVAYYKCPKCSLTTTDSMVMISDDITHDHHAVHRFTEIAVEHLNQKLPLLTRIVRFSDGAPSQYKSRGPFMDVSYGKTDYGVDYQHEFFGSRHGKGPSDGESGVIKRQATDAVMAGKVVITNAHELYTYTKEHSTRPAPNDTSDECHHFQRSIFWVEGINRSRDRQSSQTVKETRQFHSVVSVEPNIIAVNKLSCFCKPCIEKKGKCCNTDYVQPYVHKDVARGVTIPAQPATPTTTTKPSEMTTVEDMDNGEPGEGVIQETRPITSGDFVAVKLAQGSRKNTELVVYMAVVLDVDGQNIVVKFMELMTSTPFMCYTWPDIQKPYTHPIEDAVCIVSPPAIGVNRRESAFYRFSDADLLRVKGLIKGRVTFK